MMKRSLLAHGLTCLVLGMALSEFFTSAIEYSSIFYAAETILTAIAIVLHIIYGYKDSKED